MDKGNSLKDASGLHHHNPRAYDGGAGFVSLDTFSSSARSRNILGQPFGRRTAVHGAGRVRTIRSAAAFAVCTLPII